jgi:hypothetical protein
MFTKPCVMGSISSFYCLALDVLIRKCRHSRSKHVTYIIRLACRRAGMSLCFYRIEWDEAAGLNACGTAEGSAVCGEWERIHMFALPVVSVILKAESETSESGQPNAPCPDSRESTVSKEAKSSLASIRYRTS